MAPGRQEIENEIGKSTQPFNFQDHHHQEQSWFSACSRGQVSLWLELDSPRCFSFLRWMVVAGIHPAAAASGTEGISEIAGFQGERENKNEGT